MPVFLDQKTKDPLSKRVNRKAVDAIDKNARPKPDSEKIEAKTNNFVIATWKELKQVTWPNWPTVFSWTVITILFTLILSLSLGFFDHFFSAGIYFVDCTSPKGRGDSTTLNQCIEETTNYILFKT